jgi:hypothetical protein
MVLDIVPVAGVSKGIMPGENAAWVRASDDSAQDRALARTVAEYQLSNKELLALVDKCKPPQSWHDEDHEGLF